MGGGRGRGVLEVWPLVSTVYGGGSLRVYDAKGRLVATLVDGFRIAGPHSVVWNGQNSNGASVSTGVYFYSLQFGGESVTRKMVLLK